MATGTDTENVAVEALLVRARVESLIFLEARLLDERDFSGWLELLAEDVTYWIPSAGDDIDPTREVSIVYDRHAQLRERVWRLESGLAYAQEPTSRTSHLHGNIEVAVGDDGVIDAHSSFVITEYRRERQYTHAGRCLHRLRDDGDGLLITLKKLDLVNNDGYFGNLSFLL
jgi:benzoate/toluate 1,2-dioxygenase beta subunit